jgi:hypothetical protein
MLVKEAGPLGFPLSCENLLADGRNINVDAFLYLLFVLRSAFDSGHPNQEDSPSGAPRQSYLQKLWTAGVRATPPWPCDQGEYDFLTLTPEVQQLDRVREGATELLKGTRAPGCR